MENKSDSSLRKDEDVFYILVATDCHLGYEENDPIIGDDSFIAFEEILIKAVDNNVDMILLGGDLFHHNCPSQKTMSRCMLLLKKYTFGDKPVYIEMVSDIAQVFSSHFVNYLDENLNVSIPVFSIHGNHDDPSGAGLVSSLDTLANAGFINYFGKWTNLDKVVLHPILMKKGKTKLALYGLSHIKDERLVRLFLSSDVTMLRPKDDPDSWLSILVLHQNRADRGAKKFIPEHVLPSFLDLVIWGHEHDCEIMPIKVEGKGFYVTQPGSSVPTSLSQGESLTKHVGLLKLHERSFKLKPLRLNTTRPFIFEEQQLNQIPLASNEQKKQSEEIVQFCMRKVEGMIQKAKDLRSGDPKQPLLPLIRLRCEYNDESQMFNLVKFGQNFQGLVANANSELIRFKRATKSRNVKDRLDGKADIEKLQELFQDAEEPESFSECVDAFVESYFQEYADKRLTVLSSKGLGEAVHRFVDFDAATAIDDIIDYQIDLTVKALQKFDVDKDNIGDLLIQMRDERERKDKEKEENVRKALDKTGASDKVRRNVEDYELDEDNFNEPPRPSKTSSDGKTNPKQRTGQARDDYDDDWTSEVPSASRAVNADYDEDDDFNSKESEGEPPPEKPAGRGRGRGRGWGRAAAAKTANTRGRAPAKPKTPRGGAASSRGARKQLNVTSSLMYQDETDSD